MSELRPVIEKVEGRLGRAGVLGVLDQLEDEVGALAVELPEQVQHGRVPAVPGDVLLADPLIVGWHGSILPARSAGPARLSEPSTRRHTGHFMSLLNR